MTPLVTLRGAGLRFTFDAVFEGLSLEIRAGEHAAFLGPNGCGKSSLFRMVRGLLEPSSGTVDLGIPADRIAGVSHEDHRALMAWEAHELWLAQFDDRMDGTSVGRWLGEGDPSPFEEDLGVEELPGRHLRELSNGEMRRVLLAKALRGKPLLLLLDEPFDGIDEAGRALLLRVLDDVAASGITLALITHRLEEIPTCIRFAHLLHRDGSSRSVPREALDAEVIRGLYDRPGGAFPEFFGPPPEDASPLVVFRQVTVSYDGQAVLDRLDWTFRADEHWALHASNGAGKTTLLRILAGDHPHAYGNDIELFGVKRGSGESIWDIKKRIGWLSPEIHAEHPGSPTALEVVLSGFFDSLGLCREPESLHLRLARGWLDHLGISEVASRRFDALSYGQQRLALFARAAVKTPRLLLLDEPFQGLDPRSRARLSDAIAALADGGRTRLLFVGHHDEERPASVTNVLRL